MLREILDVFQDDPSSQRRWFHDDYFDLFVREGGGDPCAQTRILEHPGELAGLAKTDDGRLEVGAMNLRLGQPQEQPATIVTGLRAELTERGTVGIGRAGEIVGRQMQIADGLMLQHSL